MTTAAAATAAARPSMREVVTSAARRALTMELRVYGSIARALSRRPAVAPGAEGFRYDEPVRMILLVFIGLSAVEIPIIDLIVHPWPAVRIPLLILGIWGLTWMIGLLCAYRMRPHAVGPDGIQVREGLEIDIPLTWDDIASVAPGHRSDEPKSPRITANDAHATLSMRMQDTTNVEIALERPTPVRLPGLSPKGGLHEVSTVRIWVDDLDGFLSAVRRHIP